MRKYAENSVEDLRCRHFVAKCSAFGLVWKAKLCASHGRAFRLEVNKGNSGILKVLLGGTSNRAFFDTERGREGREQRKKKEMTSEEGNIERSEVRSKRTTRG